MANNVTLTGTLTITPPGAPTFERDVQDSDSMAGNVMAQGQMSAGLTLTAVPLGQVTSPGWAWFENLDAANPVTLFNGNSGAANTQMAVYPAGVGYGIKLPPACVPYVQATTAAVQLDYAIAQV